MEMEKQEHARVLDLISQARSNQNRTGSLHRDALQKLLSLAHSSTTDLKIVAAGNIPHFITDFPDLEEQAINAVYDLCEDQSSQVRIEGYRAISAISGADNKLVKRNADVLLQLLQSDEPEEVAVVKKALIDHIAMGPAVTLGVLCDQLSPIGEEVDEEEKSIRERLRTLVLNFFLEDGQASIREHVSPNSPSEEILLESLNALLPQLDFPLTERIVTDLILKLPVFQPPSNRGEPLLRVLLERASHEIRKDGKPSLSACQPVLQLAQDLVIVHRASSPLPLLRHYCGSLTGKIFLQQLPRSDRLSIVNSLADLLSFCHQHCSGDLDVLQHQWKIVDATPFLLETLFGAIADKTCGANCTVLLRNCLYRKNRQQWTISPILQNTLTRLKGLTDKLPPQENKRELQKLLMFLMPSAKPPPPPTNIQPAVIVAPPSVRVTAQLQPVTRQKFTLSQPTAFETAGSSKEARPQSTPILSAQKRKSTGDFHDKPQPQAGPRLSLLNRLQSSTPEPASIAQAQMQGLSIKGAASIASTHTGSQANTPQTASNPGSHPSLLDRLQGVNTSRASSGQPASTPESRHHKRRKRT